ncbi:hypothetical protein Tco_0029617, partial [Tanacetum coccineum]
QNEVNDIRAERIAKSANPLALLAAAQLYSDNYYQAPKPQRTNTTSSFTRPSASTRHKGKEIAKPATPQSELYKPTNNNLRTSSNSRNKTEDTTPRYNNDNQSVQFGNQRTMIVDEAKETVGSQRTRMKRLKKRNWKHITVSWQRFRRSYQKNPVQLNSHWNNDENNVFANERQHSENNTAKCVDERVALANLIANLTLDTEENKTILKQLKKANASLTQELDECKTNLDETNRALREATSCRDSCLITFQNKQNEFEKYKDFNDLTIDYEILQTNLNDTLGLLALKDIEIKEG